MPDWKAFAKKLLWLTACAGLAACQTPESAKRKLVSATFVNVDPSSQVLFASFDGNSACGSSGDTCSVWLPEQWQPGRRAIVKWTLDPSPEQNADGSRQPPYGPGGTGTHELSHWRAMHDNNRVLLALNVEVPRYASPYHLDLVFLPCKRVAVLIDAADLRRVMGNLPGGQEYEAEIRRRRGAAGDCQPPRVGE